MPSAGEISGFELKLVALTRRSSGQRLARSGTVDSAAIPVGQRCGRAHCRLVGKFWDRSSIVVEGDAAASRLTEAYALQRWMNACGGRGNYPIKFNGSIFTVDPKYTGKPELQPRLARVGRLLLVAEHAAAVPAAAGLRRFRSDAAALQVLPHAAPLCKARAKIYHQVNGVYFPETMTAFGTYSNGDYGWDRRYVKPKDVMCPAWQYCWHQGLELVGLMLDYYDYTEDETFLTGELLPMARDVLAWFDARFPRDKAGKIELRPTQVLETYRPQDVLDVQGRVVGRHEVVNDTPTVAGLESVLTRLLAAPRSAGRRSPTEKLAGHEENLATIAPGKRKRKTFIRRAEDYPKNAWNIENGELYAVSPFRLFGVGKPNLATGLIRISGGCSLDCGGINLRWPVCRRPVGMTDEAQRQLLAKVANKHPNHRFPAMWGPNTIGSPTRLSAGTSC